MQPTLPTLLFVRVRCSGMLSDSGRSLPFSLATVGVAGVQSRAQTVVCCSLPSWCSVGDVHGSLQNLLQTLYLNKVVDRDGDWVAGHRTVVQTGDLIGRGTQDADVISYVRGLQVRVALFALPRVGT